MIRRVESAEEMMREFRIKSSGTDIGTIQAFIDAVGRQGGEMFVVSTKADDSYDKGYADGRADIIEKIKELGAKV